MSFKRTVFWAGVVSTLSGLLAGCGDDQNFRPVIGPNSTLSLTIQGKTLEVELALDKLSRATGLMHRDSLGENAGMLFVYKSPEKLSFWMRNTTVPLSIAFLSDEGEIRQIEDMKPLDETEIVSKNRLRYALEVPQGWFERNGIQVGARIDDFPKKVDGLPVR